MKVELLRLSRIVNRVKNYESIIDERSMGFAEECNNENNYTTDNYGCLDSAQNTDDANIDDPDATRVHEDYDNEKSVYTDESALKVHVESSKEGNMDNDYSEEACGFQTTSTDYGNSVGVKGQYDNEKTDSSKEELDSYDIESDSVDLDDSLDDDIYVPQNISFRKFLSKMKKLKPLAQMAENKFVQEISQTSINLHKSLMLSNNLKYYTDVAESFNYNEPDIRKLRRKLKYDYRYRFYERINE